MYQFNSKAYEYSDDYDEFLDLSDFSKPQESEKNKEDSNSLISVYEAVEDDDIKDWHDREDSLSF